MAVHTNVQTLLHNAVVLNGIKSLTLDKTIDPLLSQADGARGDSVVGDLGSSFDVSMEFEANDSPNLGVREGRPGFANKGVLTWKTQLDSNAGTVKTYILTNVVLGAWGLSTDQANPNGETLGGRTQSPADTLSVA